MSSVESIFNDFPNHLTIIFGDFNLPNINLSNDNPGLVYVLVSPVFLRRSRLMVSS